MGMPNESAKACVELRETIESLTKQLAEQAQALEEANIALRYLADDYCELCDWRNCGIDQLHGIDSCIERIKKIALSTDKQSKTELEKQK